MQFALDSFIYVKPKKNYIIENLRGKNGGGKNSPNSYIIAGKNITSSLSAFKKEKLS